MPQLQLRSLLGQVNTLIQTSHNIFGFVIIKQEKLTNLIDEVANCIPADVKEAEMVLAQKEEIVQKSQNRAEIIIQEAMNKQEMLTNEHEIVKKAQETINNQKQQVETYCENLQNAAVKNAEEIKTTAIREAATIQNQANDYAERLFNNLAANISQMLDSVNTCRQALANQRDQQHSYTENAENETQETNTDYE
ncbi:MAG: hypothetical protein K6C94_00950 [Candidatus Gastranaerophilales bacterium]|nr:hypothetical protein [Candidatus Gastranaerophilales bacterium]